MGKRQVKNEFRKKNSKDGKGHPTYIYAREGNVYHYLGLTHAEVTKGVKNIPLEKNPNPEDKRKAFFRPKAEKGNRSSFGKKLHWSFSEGDKKQIKKYLK